MGVASLSRRGLSGDWMIRGRGLGVTRQLSTSQILGSRTPTITLLLYRLPFGNEGQIWCATAEVRSTLTCQIPCEFVHCIGFRWPKNHNFGHILTLWGFIYRLHFSNKGQIWCATADARSTHTGHISSECVHCGGFRWRKTHFWA